MTIQDLVQLYGQAPQVETLRKTIGEKSVKTIFLDGLVASSAPLLLSTVITRQSKAHSLIILNDEEEAGYFYQDLKQVLGDGQVLFFPSSFRRAIKYAQRDAANEILRTEVLTSLASESASSLIVTHPEALAEQVVSAEQLKAQTLVLRKGQTIAVDGLVRQLRDMGLHEVDYVYEPGQFAQRGSILDVYSYSSEYPFRLDFFGDDVDSIRTFEVDDQLSRDQRSEVTLVSSAATLSQPSSTASRSILHYLPTGSFVFAKDFSYIHDTIDHICQETNPEDVQVMSGDEWQKTMTSFRQVEFGSHPSQTPEVTLSFHTAPQPLYHKNFDLLRQSLADYQAKGYHLYILADSQKQLDRLHDILSPQDVELSPLTSHLSTLNSPLSTLNYISTSLHAGFIDHDQQLCVFTDHEIFDRYHRYSLRSDKARNGKVALTLKELQQFEMGDYIVHVDHGIGKFGGLVRMPIQSERVKYQEMIKIIYQGGGAIYVSIHSLYKVSKYKAQDNGEPPRLSQLGTGQWERMKERTKNKLKDIARDLIKLYAARKREKGFAFSADSYLQHELEASFLYEDTPDQLKTTNEVKGIWNRLAPWIAWYVGM